MRTGTSFLKKLVLGFVLVISVSCSSHRPLLIVIDKSESVFINDQYLLADSLLRLNRDRHTISTDVLRAFVMSYQEWIRTDSLLEVCQTYGNQFQEQQFEE